MRKLKILISAYAFAPGGSETAIGWNWAMTLVERGHEVWVLVRPDPNRSRVEAYEQEYGLPERLHIHYVDWPYDLEKTWVNRLPMNYYWHYFDWQKYAFEKAQQLHEREQFDLVQHLTWGTIRTPSLMGQLGIPFIFGPVAGGERTSGPLRRVLDFRGRVEEVVRDMSLRLMLLRPHMNKMFALADRIYLTSEQTQDLVPPKYHDKSHVSLAIALGDNFSVAKLAREGSKDKDLRLLYVGRFLNWKGMAIGLRALAQALKAIPTLHLTMVGQGPEEKRWKTLAGELGISDRIDWIDWVDQKQLHQIYQDHDLFLFPSFHDSGGMVILESMAQALPVVCLDLGGPGVMVNESCGRVIVTANKTADEVVQDMADAIVTLSQDHQLYSSLSRGALRRVEDFSWDSIVARVYEEFEGCKKITEGQLSR